MGRMRPIFSRDGEGQIGALWRSRCHWVEVVGARGGSETRRGEESIEGFLELELGRRASSVEDVLLGG
jgi:hypothetical protein